ncbi:MAG: NAD(P)-dependent oxidoreductase [Pseudomonadota bacterium]|jgi:dTDP-4-dehydrorhamnose reductase
MGFYKKILLLGKDGQVGWELQRALAPLGELTSLNRSECDLANAIQIQAVLEKYEPEVIVNAAAYTAVDKAEEDREGARRINVDAVAELALYAREMGALLVHYSTDYVFDGTKTDAYVEDDITNPLSVYGSTKLEGENKIRDALCRHLIFRTSWVYAARGGNFARTILRLAQERGALNVIDDQIGAPTSAELIADVTAHALRDVLSGRAPGGTYHLAAAGETSWYGYAQFVIDRARQQGVALKLDEAALKPIPASDYPLPAKRPQNSRLNTHLLERSFALKLPQWQQGVARVLDEWQTQ